MTIAKQLFLNQPYGAYFHRDMPREDEELTHVGPGTPCGEYLRRFWHPIAVSEELKDLPQALKIMDEELVVFRDGSGQVGCMELHCSHRGTSLEFGLIEEHGIRCCYHGWLYGVDGRILDTPGEPPDSTYKERLCHGAYPTHEFNGLVFAYMGPPDKQPPFPVLDTFEVPGSYYAVAERCIVPANWLQINDNTADPLHLRMLHTLSSGPQFNASLGRPSEMDWAETPVGLVSLDTRRVEDNVWVRLDDLILPNMVQAAPTFEDGKQEKPLMLPDFFGWNVPVDDTHTLEIFVIRWPEGEELPDDRKALVRQTVNERPSYEDAQRRPTDYEVFVSQRPIALHALEHLAETDRGAIMHRRLIKEGIQAVQQGLDPKGIFREPQGHIPTYASGHIRRITPAATPGEDREILRQSGQEWLDHCLKNPPSQAAQTTHRTPYQKT